MKHAIKTGHDLSQFVRFNILTDTKENMGLFNNLFGGKEVYTKKKEEKAIPWIPLTSDLTQLEEIEEKSKTKPQLIFKHSTTVASVEWLFNMFVESDFDFTEQASRSLLFDLHGYREVSNEVAINFSVDSPIATIIGY